MTFELFKRVALSEDIPEYNMRRGDVATVVEHHPGVDKDGYSLEVFNALGETIATITVAESQIEPLRRNEILQVRLLEEAI